MSKQIINVGSDNLSGDGESIRAAFVKTNANFDEIYLDLYSTVLGTSVLSGRLTVDPTLVPNNAVDIQTFNITGLTTNHKIVVTPATAIPYGIFISAAWPSSSNTVSIQVTNISDSNIDLTNIDISYIAWI